MLALAFLLMIGGNLIVEGFGYHVPKGYTYFAMAFSVFVEMLNIRMRSRRPFTCRPSEPVSAPHGPGDGRGVKASVRTLLSGLVDYAGLFPPAATPDDRGGSALRRA